MHEMHQGIETCDNHAGLQTLWLIVLAPFVY